jgi:hypothetical protein
MASFQTATKLSGDVQALDQDPRAYAPPRCDRCGGVIGVYEPLVYLVKGSVRETSRAAEPNLSLTPAGPCFHAGCFERPK